MGHLVNPKAFRLGWSQSWENIWFVNNLYYPEFLHLMLKVRSFLSYFFKTRIFEKIGIIFSHSTIIKFLKNIVIQVFVYHGIIENFLQEFIYDTSDDYLKDHILKPERFCFSPQNLFSYRFFILYCLCIRKIGFMSFWNFKKHTFASLLKLTSSLNPYSLRKFLELLNRVHLKKFGFKSFLKHNDIYVFFCFVLKIFKLWKNTSLKGNVFQSDIFRKIFFTHFWHYFLKGFTNSVLDLVNIIISSFSFMLQQIKLQMFSLSNETINAKFLAGFFAKKFRQQFTIRELVNPLKFELIRVSSVIRYSNLSLLKSHMLWNTRKNESVLFYKGFYKLLLSRLFFLNIKLIKNFYNKNFYFLSFYSFVIIKLFYKESAVNSKNNIIGLSSKFVDNLLYNNMFANTLMYLSDSKDFFYSLFRGPFSFLLNENNNFYYFFENIADIFYCSYKLHFFKNKKSLAYELNITKFTSSFYNKLFQKHYSGFMLSCLGGGNNMKTRKSLVNDSKNLVLAGFKFHFVGRFSRKQRAASLWFKVGRVPLSSVGADIDYGLSTVPIRNSSVLLRSEFIV